MLEADRLGHEEGWYFTITEMSGREEHGWYLFIGEQADLNRYGRLYGDDPQNVRPGRIGVGGSN